jgi:hypothetical protein
MADGLSVTEEGGHVMDTQQTEQAYEAPELVEVGGFADLTLGDLGMNNEGYDSYA